jgi:hypothetical protein
MSRHLTVVKAEDRTATAWVCVDCNAAVAGISDHEAGKRLPIPFDGDDSVIDAVNGGVYDCEHHLAADWHDWPERYHDEHSEQCETREHSTSPCESCGNTDHGTRQAVTITVR